MFDFRQPEEAGKLADESLLINISVKNSCYTLPLFNRQ